MAREAARAAGVNPWPIDDARHNLTLLAQELTLLEGHLGDEGRSCPECITKHALAASGLAQEGRRLEQGPRFKELWQATERVAGQTLRSPDLQAVRGLRQEVVRAVVDLYRPDAMQAHEKMARGSVDMANFLEEFDRLSRFFEEVSRAIPGDSGKRGQPADAMITGAPTEMAQIRTGRDAADIGLTQAWAGLRLDPIFANGSDGFSVADIKAFLASDPGRCLLALFNMLACLLGLPGCKTTGMPTCPLPPSPKPQPIPPCGGKCVPGQLCINNECKCMPDACGSAACPSPCKPCAKCIANKCVPITPDITGEEDACWEMVNALTGDPAHPGGFMKLSLTSPAQCYDFGQLNPPNPATGLPQYYWGKIPSNTQGCP